MRGGPAGIAASARCWRMASSERGSSSPGGVEHAVEHEGSGWRTPSSASSPRVRSASASAVCSGRLTSISVVTVGRRARRDAGGVEVALRRRPASGPRQEVPEVLVSMKPLHARGQRQQAQGVARGRGVEDDVVVARRSPSGSPSSSANSSNAAISTVQAPDELSSMLATAVVGQQPAVGTDDPLAICGAPRPRDRCSSRAAPARRRWPPGAAAASEVSSTSSRFDAGSVVTSSTRPAAVGERDGGRAGKSRSCPCRPCR